MAISPTLCFNFNEFLSSKLVFSASSWSLVTVALKIEAGVNLPLFVTMAIPNCTPIASQ